MNRGIVILLLISDLLLSPVDVFGEGMEIKIKIQGSTTVNPVVVEAAELFTREKGWVIFVDTQGGSSGGVSAVGDGLADIGMISKPVSVEDKKKYPEINFKSYAIGLDGVGLVVSRSVWDGGIQFLTRKQVQYLYEGKIKNWKEVGGSQAPVVFYNKEPGRGTWEVFANWLYDGHENAPFVSHPEVGGNEEARNKIALHPSAITQLSYAWTKGADKIKAVGIKKANGEVIFPSRETIKNGEYPLARTLYLITDGPANGYIREFIDYILSGPGQTLVEKHGYLPIQ